MKVDLTSTKDLLFLSQVPSSAFDSSPIDNHSAAQISDLISLLRPMTAPEQAIADQSELEDFCRLAPEQRQLTDRLRGVLAETAVTGVIRYPWPLLQPLVTQVMQEQLTKYEEEEHVEVGPARPILEGSGGDSVQELCQRFTQLLSAFESHPWTLQRLCEVLLEPQKQYKRLHKLALAIEKLLLVTGEVSLSEQPGPPPLLGQLAHVNEVPRPPAAAAAAAAGNAVSRQGDADGSGLVAAALSIRGSAPQPNAAAAAAGDVAAPPAAGNPGDTAEAMQVDAAEPASAAAGAANGTDDGSSGSGNLAQTTDPQQPHGTAAAAMAVDEGPAGST